MLLRGNGGKVSTNLICDIKNLNQKVWFSEDYITNILSLSKIERDYRITYDSQKDHAFIVHRPGKFSIYVSTFSIP